MSNMSLGSTHSPPHSIALPPCMATLLSAWQLGRLADAFKFDISLPDFLLGSFLANLLDR